MKIYTFKRIVVTLTVMLYALLLFPLLLNQKSEIYQLSGFIQTTIAMIVGISLAAFIWREKEARDYEKEKQNLDERYRKQRNAFSFYMFVGLGYALPLGFVFLHLLHIDQLSTRTLLLVFTVFFLIFQLALYIYKKK